MIVHIFTGYDFQESIEAAKYRNVKYLFNGGTKEGYKFQRSSIVLA